MNKETEEAEKWANKTLDDFRETVYSEYMEEFRKGAWMFDKESWINGFYAGYIKAKQEK
jgi:hypothetical protein